MKSRINLYSDTLLPTQSRLAFANLVVGAVCILMLALVLGGIGYWGVMTQQQQLQQVKAQARDYTQQKTQLEQKIAAHLPSPELVAKVELETQQLELKRLLLTELGSRKALTSKGFAPLLTDLATVADGATWLSRIVVDDNHFVFEGYAQQPENVPLWVGRLKSTETLRGQTFAAMTMARGDGEPLGFMLTSKPSAEKSQ